MANHHSLKAWTEAHAVVIGVLEASREHWKPWASAAFGQLQRSSLSVQLNIAEGWAFPNSPTCTRHLSIAHGSAMETADLVDLLIETRVVSGRLADELKFHSDLSIKLLIGLLKKRRPLTVPS
ncbi:MAG: four helix bundle protein [Gemmatimonadota bacterium]